MPFTLVQLCEKNSLPWMHLGMQYYSWPGMCNCVCLYSAMFKFKLVMLYFLHQKHSTPHIQVEHWGGNELTLFPSWKLHIRSGVVWPHSVWSVKKHCWDTHHIATYDWSLGTVHRTCGGPAAKTFYCKNFLGLPPNSKNFRAPFLPCKLLVNPIGKYVNSIFTGKFVVIFFTAPSYKRQIF